jgi:hypothetical protein
MPTVLKPEHQAFVNAYLVEPNATKAAIAAGYSKKAARVQGHRLITNANIAESIKAAQQRSVDRTGVTIDRVNQELALIAFMGLAEMNPAHKIAALKLLGDHLGMWKGESDQTPALNVNINVDDRRQFFLNLRDSLAAVPGAAEALAGFLRAKQPDAGQK